MAVRIANAIPGAGALATLYSDNGITGKSNPLTTDATGGFDFYVASGRYDLVFSGSMIATKILASVEIAEEWTPQFINLSNQSANPTPIAGTVNLYTKSSDKGLYYKNESGGETGPLSSNGSATFTTPVTVPNPFPFDVDMAFKGPNPWADIRRFGARSPSIGVVPQIPGITASINLGSPTATLSAASTFQNGDGVNIFYAGAANAMATPGAPTVTPSVSSAMTGTGFVVNAPAGGATTYNYCIRAVKKEGAITACSATGTTTIGSASLGARSVAITSYARSGATVTVTTSAAHGLSVGSMVYQEGSTDTTNFGGWFPVATTADSTHYTYTAGLDSTAGAATSATSGNAHWFNCNHLTWTTVAGAWKYYIYGRTGAGPWALLGVSQPDNGTSALYWDDFGSPMMDNFNGEYYAPTTSAAGATSDNLVTTILSGAGTTTLTLANNAGTTVSAKTILFDNAPAILAAEVAGQVYIPAGVAFAVNSHLTLPNNSTINMAGSLYLNDTFEPGTGSRWYGSLSPQGASVPAFSWEGQNTVTVDRANPGVYSVLTTVNSPAMYGLQFATPQTNNVKFVFLEGDFNRLEKINFTTGSSVADLMSTALTLRGTSTNTAFPNILKDITFLSPQLAANGDSATPAFLCYFCGMTRMDNIHTVGRNIVYTPPPSGGDLQIKFGRDQGGNMPFVTVVPSTGGGVGGTYSIDGFELDTMPHAIFANLPVSATTNNGTVTLINPYPPSSGVASVTGNAVQALVVIPSGDPILNGQNRNFASPGTGFFSDHIVGVNGPTGGIGYLMTPPAAAGVALGAGGGVPVGTWLYQLTALDVLGNETALGFNSASVVVTGGNQTVTITPPTKPFGSVSYKAYRHNPGGGVGQVNVAATAWGVNMVDTFGFTAGAPPAALALSSGFSSVGLQAPQLAIDVLSLGADNTGVADSRAVIQKAIDFLSPTGGDIKIRKGIYLIGAPGLVITGPGIRIYGEGVPGWGATHSDSTVLATNAAINILTVGTSGVLHHEGVYIENLTFRDTGGIALGGLLIRNTNRNTLVRPNFEDFATAGSYGLSITNLVGGLFDASYNNIYQPFSRNNDTGFILNSPQTNIYGGEVNGNTFGMDIQSGQSFIYGTNIETGMASIGINLSANDCQINAHVEGAAGFSGNTGILVNSGASRNHISGSATKFTTAINLAAGSFSNVVDMTGMQNNTTPILDNGDGNLIIQPNKSILLNTFISSARDAAGFVEKQIPGSTHMPALVLPSRGLMAFKDTTSTGGLWLQGDAASRAAVGGGCSGSASGGGSSLKASATDAWMIRGGNTAGQIDFFSNTGLTSGVDFTPTLRASLSPAGFVPPTIAFASLGTPANGNFVYCSDCNIANPCTGGGTGAFAKRLAGTWICN